MYKKIKKICEDNYGSTIRKSCSDSAVSISMGEMRDRVIMKGEELYLLIMNCEGRIVDSFIFSFFNNKNHKIKIEFRQQIKKGELDELIEKFVNADMMLNKLFNIHEINSIEYNDSNFLAFKKRSTASTKMIQYEFNKAGKYVQLVKNGTHISSYIK